jgi:hypothetical protein
VGYARTNVISSRTSFVIAYIEIYVFRGNPFQAHSLEQSYHHKYKCKNNTELIYLTFIHCTCKVEKHKQSFLSENCEQTFPNKKHKQSNAHGKHKQFFPSENYNRARYAHTRATSADSIPPRSL